MEVYASLQNAISYEAFAPLELMSPAAMSSMESGMEWQWLTSSLTRNGVAIAGSLVALGTAGSAIAAPPQPLEPMLVAAAQHTLDRGDRGTAVAHLQHRLKDRGYFNGPVTGFYGRLTEGAVAHFQEAKGLAVDGKAGPRTLSALDARSSGSSSSDRSISTTKVLRRGSQGAAVTALQQRLRRLGYFDGPVTGFFGRLTEGAVTQFQRQKGLSADGVVGPKTYAALGTASGQTTSTARATQPSRGVLRYGDRGAEVAALQTRLRSLGYFHNSSTGFFGRKTEAAVVKFQRSQGLAADGQVGSRTLAALQAPRSATSSPTDGDRSKPARVQVNRAPRAEANVPPSPSPRPPVMPISPTPSPTVAVSPVPATPLAPPVPQPSPAGSPATSPSPKPEAIAPGSPAPSPGAMVLSPGASGPAVADLQQQLRDAGYLDGPVTGFYGNFTEQAVRQFQQEKGLPVTGTVTVETLKELEAAQ